MTGSLPAGVEVVSSSCTVGRCDNNLLWQGSSVRRVAVSRHGR